MAERGEVCDICGKEAWRERDGVLLCGPCWNVAIARDQSERVDGG